VLVVVISMALMFSGCGGDQKNSRSDSEPQPPNFIFILAGADMSASKTASLRFCKNRNRRPRLEMSSSIFTGKQVHAVRGDALTLHGAPTGGLPVSGASWTRNENPGLPVNRAAPSGVLV
jgi:hypothetical protein